MHQSTGTEDSVMRVSDFFSFFAYLAVFWALVLFYWLMAWGEEGVDFYTIVLANILSREPHHHIDNG